MTTQKRSSALPDVPTIAESGADLGLAQFVRAEHAKYEQIVKRSDAKAD